MDHSSINHGSSPDLEASQKEFWEATKDEYERNQRNAERARKWYRQQVPTGEVMGASDRMPAGSQPEERFSMNTLHGLMPDAYNRHTSDHRAARTTAAAAAQLQRVVFCEYRRVVEGRCYRNV